MPPGRLLGTQGGGGIAPGRRHRPTEELPPLKEWGRRFRVALCYPSTYEVGMANLGLHALYETINSRDRMLADRFFVDPGGRVKPLSVERAMPAREYDLVAFTVQFEPDYPQIARFLELSGIEPRAARRTDGDPFVIAGGPAPSANPEPAAAFFDAIYIGEYEGGGPAALDELARLVATGAPRDAALEALSAVPHLYVPSLNRFTFDGPRTLAFEYDGRAALPIDGARPDLTGRRPPCTAIRTSKAEFSDMHLVEFTRGCPFGCRFCMAGFVSRPFRTFDEAQVAKAAAATGGRGKVGAIGELAAGHPQFRGIIAGLEGQGIRVSPSSMRVEHLDDGAIAALQRAGTRTLTLAPESPSPRLSRALNKPFDRDALLGAVERATAAGVERIKLYFLVGLPGETDDDVMAIPALAREAHAIVTRVGARTRLGALSLSINPFVPKPWTPLQWAPMAAPDEVARKLDAISRGLAGLSNIEVRHASVHETLWEAVLARADRRAAVLIEAAAQRNVKTALASRDIGFDPAAFALRPRDDGERFPWEVVRHGCTRAFLRRELDRYTAAEPTAPCDVTTCRACGACG